VEEIVSAAGADPSAYAARLQRIVREELDRRYLAGARNLVEVSLSVDMLRAQEAEIRNLMSVVADSHELRNELKNSPLQPVFDAAPLLDDRQFNQIMEPWVALQSFYETSPTRATAVAAALVNALPRLSAARRQVLSTSLQDERLKKDIAVYLPLVEADPLLIPADFGSFAIEQLENAQGDALVDELDTSSDAFRLFRAWLRTSSPPPEPQDGFISLLIAELEQYAPAPSSPRVPQPAAADFDLSEDHLRALADTVAALHTVSRAGDLQEACLAAFDAALESESRNSFVNLANVALSLGGGDAQSIAERLIAAYYNHDSDGLLQYAAERKADLSKPLRHALTEQLQTVLTNTTFEMELRLSAAAVLVEIDPSQSEGRIGPSIARLAGEGDWETAAEVLNRYPEAAEKYAADIATSALARVESELPLLSESAEHFISLVLPTLADEQRSSLREMLFRSVTEGDETEATNAAAAADRFVVLDPTFGPYREALLRQLFDSIAQDQEPPETTAEIVIARATALDRDRRASLVAQLERWILTPGDRQVATSEAAANLEDAAPAERMKLVEALVNAETAAAGDPSLRAQLLTAAKNIKGSDRSNAAKRYEARVSAIRNEESEENEQVLAELQEMS
jgi:hypothetical protein